MNALSVLVGFFESAAKLSPTVNPIPELIATGNLQIRLKLAENQTLAATYLADLANDVSPEVRIAVTDHPNTPLPILELLASDDHPDVRYALAENANVPKHILKMLSRDENPYVSFRANTTLSRIQEPQHEPIRISLIRCA